MSQLHRLALAGCGGMGRRHLRGYRVLEDFEPGRPVTMAEVINGSLNHYQSVANRELGVEV